MALLEQKEVEVNGKKFIISKMDCMTARKVMALYPSSLIPKVGDYSINEEMSLLLMSHVAVPLEKSILPLDNATLVKNHVKDAEMLLRLEAEMMKYNFSFFQPERISTFLEDIAQKVQAWTSKTLKTSSVQ